MLVLLSLRKCFADDEENVWHPGYLLAVRQPHWTSVIALSERSRKHSRHTTDVTRWAGPMGNWSALPSVVVAIGKSQTALERTGSSCTPCPGGSILPSRSNESMVATTVLVTCSMPLSEFSMR